MISVKCTPAMHTGWRDPFKKLQFGWTNWQASCGKRPICVKKKCVFKNIRIRVAGASVSHTKIIMKLSRCLHYKTRTRASFTPGWLFDFVSRLHDDGSFHISVIWRCTSCWKNTRVIQNRKHYACTTRSSPPAVRFHTETGVRFAFTWYRCEISHWSEILAPVQQTGWPHAGVTRAGMTFCGGIM